MKCPLCGLGMRDLNGNWFCDNCNEYMVHMDLSGETREQLKERIKKMESALDRVKGITEEEIENLLLNTEGKETYFIPTKFKQLITDKIDGR